MNSLLHDPNSIIQFTHKQHCSGQESAGKSRFQHTLA